jgi:hypothetical protein
MSRTKWFFWALGISWSAWGALLNGVDPNNLGQGDWIWVMSSAENALGLTTPQAVIDYEASNGMQWVCVKAGDGHSAWSQWNSTIINEAHARGLQIFAWVYVYGNNSGVYGSNSPANVAGEIGAIYSAGSAGLVRAPEFTGMTVLGNSQVRLNLRGLTGKNFMLYTSTDLLNWSLLGAIPNPTGAAQFLDSVNGPQKFYRAAQP